MIQAVLPPPLIMHAGLRLNGVRAAGALVLRPLKVYIASAERSQGVHIKAITRAVSLKLQPIGSRTESRVLHLR